MSCTMSTKPYVLSCDTHSCHFCPWPSGRAESDFIKNLELFKVQCRMDTSASFLRETMYALNNSHLKGDFARKISFAGTGIQTHDPLTW